MQNGGGKGITKMATGTRPFRTDRGVAPAERVTRSMIGQLLLSKGFSEVDDERLMHGSAVSQLLSAVAPDGSPIKARVRLCWRRPEGKKRTSKYSAAQLSASLRNGDWNATLRHLQKRDEQMGITHSLLAQRDGTGFAFAALVPTKDLAAIWRRRRDVSKRSSAPDNPAGGERTMR